MAIHCCLEMWNPSYRYEEGLFLFVLVFICSIQVLLSRLELVHHHPVINYLCLRPFIFEFFPCFPQQKHLRKWVPQKL